MTLRDYGRILRKHWLLIALCTIFAVAAAVAAVVASTPLYTASTQLFVSTSPSDSAGVSGLYNGAQFSEQRVTSYAQIINSPVVTAPVIRRLGLPYTPDQLGKQISATAPLNTVLINLTVTDPSPQRAAAIANAVSAQFVQEVNSLEAPAAGGHSPVRVTVVRQATAPTAPSSPKKKLDLALGLLVGLAIGVGGAVLRETLDTSIKSHEELDELTGTGSVGLISFDKEAAANRLVVQTRPHSPRAEGYRQLRTNLQFVHIDSRPRSIVITSCLPGEGKTTSACNLALAFAQAGARVLLVDGDLRNPKVADYTGLEGAAGLTTLLTGRASFEDVAQEWGGGLLRVLPSGERPPNPSELLASRTMTSLLRQWEEAFDMVVIDAPPLLPVTDGAVLAAVCGGALLVVRHGRTHRAHISRAVEALQSVQAQLLGGVLNMVPTKGPDSYGYGAYAYTDGSRGAPRRPVPPSGRPSFPPAPAPGREPVPVSTAPTRDPGTSEPFPGARAHPAAPERYAAAQPEPGPPQPS